MRLSKQLKILIFYNVFSINSNFDAYNKNINSRPITPQGSKKAKTGRSNPFSIQNSPISVKHQNEQENDEYTELCYKPVSTFDDQDRVETKESQHQEDLDESTSNSSINQSFHTHLSMNNSNIRNKGDDFKTKLKTEICRFWEMNKACKFGDNVINLLFI